MMRATIPLVTICLLAIVTASTAVASPERLRGAPTPVSAVKALVRIAGIRNQRCRLDWKCVPMTQRLIRRVKTIEAREHGVDPLIRAQNVAQRNDVRLLSKGGSHALVQWIAHFHPALRLTFVVKHTANGWRLDDSYCSGRPSTSLYRKFGARPC